MHLTYQTAGHQRPALCRESTVYSHPRVQTGSRSSQPPLSITKVLPALEKIKIFKFKYGFHRVLLSHSHT